MNEMQLISREVTIIRWLLIGLIVLFLWILYAVTSSLKEILRLKDSNEPAIDWEHAQIELDDLLASNELIQARRLGQRWVEQRPGDPMAHWQLARAHFRLEEPVDAKAHFEKVIELAPDWEDYVEPWLERVNEAISENRPRSID